MLGIAHLCVSNSKIRPSLSRCSATDGAGRGEYHQEGHFYTGHEMGVGQNFLFPDLVHDIEKLHTFTVFYCPGGRM